MRPATLPKAQSPRPDASPRPTRYLRLRLPGGAGASVLSAALLLALPLALAQPGMAPAQGTSGASSGGTELSLSGLRQDIAAPVEVTADSLSVNRAAGTAQFRGNVVISQGQMRLAAGLVSVFYAEGDSSQITRIEAEEGVTLATPAEAAESQSATYDPGNGSLVMRGNVLLTQGANTITGQSLNVDLRSGTGRMEGRVRTTLSPAQDPVGGQGN